MHREKKTGSNIVKNHVSIGNTKMSALGKKIVAKYCRFGCNGRKNETNKNFRVHIVTSTM